MTSTELTKLTAVEARDAMASGKLTAEAYIDACLAHIAKRDPQVEAWAHLSPDLAREQARGADKALKAGIRPGLLHGLPVGIKDIIATGDQPTQNGSPIYLGHQPADDAACVTQLREAGAVIMGKTVTTEFATLTPNKTHNPHNPAHTPGGSSSGSAAAVGAAMIPLSLGTQTGGSVIRPGSFCGVFALKPTFGLISRIGVTMQSHMLDTVGLYGRSVEDLALATDAMSAHDPRDAQSYPRGTLGLLEQTRAKTAGEPTFAFFKTPAWEQAEASTKTLLPEFVKGLGKQCTEISLGSPFDRIIALHLAIMGGENAHYFREFYEQKGDLLSPGLKGRIAESRKVLAMDYLDAIRLREECNALVDKALGTYDALIVPASPGPAPKGLNSTGNAVFNGMWTYLGVPCVSLPLFQVDGMPLGLQLIGRRREDGKLLRTAKWLAERAGKTRV